MEQGVVSPSVLSQDDTVDGENVPGDLPQRCYLDKQTQRLGLTRKNLNCIVDKIINSLWALVYKHIPAYL